MLRKNNKEKWITSNVTCTRDQHTSFWLIKQRMEGKNAHVKKYGLQKTINNKYKRINIRKLVLSLCVSRETIEKKTTTPSLASDDVSLSLSNMRQSNPTNASEDQNRRSVVSISVEGVNTRLTLATQKNNLRKVICCGNNMNERVA